MTALVLAGDPSLHTPSQLTSAMRIRNAWPLEPESRIQSLRGYVLHTPCRQIVRDVYIAESLYPDATPQVSFVLPGPRPSMRTPREDGRRHYSEVDLARSIEHRPGGPQSYEIPGVVNHSAVGAACARAHRPRPDALPGLATGHDVSRVPGRDGLVPDTPLATSIE